MQVSSNIPPFVRTILLCAVLAVPAFAWADDYAEVTKLMRAGKPADAIEKAERYIAINPKDAQMRFIKGVVQADSGRTPDAIATFSKLIEDYPELPEPYNNLAVVYAGQGQFEKAGTTLEAAIRTNPSYATAHANLGDVYAKLASQAYIKALQLDASNTALKPKLALIRELFAAAGPSTTAKAAQQQPTAATLAAAPSPPGKNVAVAKAAQPQAAASNLAAASSPPSKSVVAKAPAAQVTSPVQAAPQPQPAPQPPTAPPVAALPIPATVPAAAVASSGSADIEAAVRAWAAAWSSKDMDRYLGAYGKEFNPTGKQSRKAWEDERRARILGKSRISVVVDGLSVKMNGNTATVKFNQSYSADSLNVANRKTLELIKDGERWVIVKEITGT